MAEVSVGVFSVVVNVVVVAVDGVGLSRHDLVI